MCKSITDFLVVNGTGQGTQKVWTDDVQRKDNIYSKSLLKMIRGALTEKKL